MTVAQVRDRPGRPPRGVHEKATGGRAQSLPARSLRARSSLRHLQDGVPLASAGPVVPSRTINLTRGPRRVQGRRDDVPAKSVEIAHESELGSVRPGPGAGIDVLTLDLLLEAPATLRECASTR